MAGRGPRPCRRPFPTIAYCRGAGPAGRPFPMQGGFPRRAHEKGRSRRETASFPERDTGGSSKQAWLYTISDDGTAARLPAG